MKGIDVSDNNGIINWDAVKNSGVEFAIIRLGFGDNLASQDDKRFEYNVSECERLGIPWGAYIYSYALSLDEARSEAEHCLRLLSGKRPMFPVWFDMEDADGYKARRGGLSKEMAVQICDTFCQILTNNRYYVGIYASLSWLNNILNDRRLDKYDKWVAQWYTRCEYDGSFGLWQYSSDGSVSGVPGRTDMNEAYYDYPGVIKSHGLNGWTELVATPEPEATQEPTAEPEAATEQETATEPTPAPEIQPQEPEKEKDNNEPTENEKAASGGILAALRALLKLILEWIKGDN